MLFGSIYQHFTFSEIYLFYLVLLLKITLFNTVQCDGEKSHEIVIKMLRVEKVGTLSERICGLKLVQIEPRSTHQKRGLCWVTNRQFYWSRSYVRLSLKIPSQYETYTVHVRIHVAPPSVLPIHKHKIGSIPFAALCSLFVPKIIKFRLCINLLQAKR